MEFNLKRLAVAIILDMIGLPVLLYWLPGLFGLVLTENVTIMLSVMLVAASWFVTDWACDVLGVLE